MRKVLEILKPGYKFEFKQLDQRHGGRRRRASLPTPTPVPQPRSRRVKSLGAPTVWCYCNTKDDGSKMVRCDKRNCRIKWFHVRCVGQENIDGEWLCRICRQ